MEQTDTVVFWDAEGVEILAISSPGIDSTIMLDIFDTPANRAAIEKETRRLITNTSEESDPF